MLILKKKTSEYSDTSNRGLKTLKTSKQNQTKKSVKKNLKFQSGCGDN